MSPPVLPADAVEEAAEALRAGLVVGIPTDTVYGVAVDPRRPGATGRVFELKGRPADLALPVLVSGPEQLAGLTGPIGASAARLVERWWPGALTIVLPAGPSLPPGLGGAGTVGVRCPDHPVARRLCSLAGPLATTSANLHGRPPLTTAADLAAALPGVALVLDGGTCAGAPSTVVDATGPGLTLLRAGRLSWEDLLASATGDGPEGR